MGKYSFYDENDPTWGTGGQTRSRATTTPGYRPDGMPMTPEYYRSRGSSITPNYSDPNAAPAVGTQRLSEVGPAYTSTAYGTGRMNRYGMGGMSAPGMSLGSPMGHLAPNRFASALGGMARAPGMSFGYQSDPWMDGPGKGDNKPGLGAAPGTAPRGDELGEGLSTLEKIYMGTAIAGGIADIYGGIQEGRRADREYEDEQENQKRKSRLFADALGSYAGSR